MGWILRTCGRRVLVIAALMMVPFVYCQIAPVAEPETVVDVLHQMSDKADVIFAGQVVAIRRPNSGVVEIEFRVDQAIRGCTAGTPYFLHEWAGLWPGDNQRYSVGQRLLMLLHAPSAAGVSSPVGGLDGAIPIRQGGAASTDAGTPRQPPFVDLRWLGAKVPRTVSYSSEPTRAEKAARASSLLLAQPQTRRMVAASSMIGTDPVASTSGNGQSGGSVASQQASVDAVIGMLTAWQKVQHEAP
jgi:hypothetical protein